MSVTDDIAWCRAALGTGVLCSWEVADVLHSLLDRLERHETHNPDPRVQHGTSEKDPEAQDARVPEDHARD